jgi:hypothetical protein
MSFHAAPSHAGPAHVAWASLVSSSAFDRSPTFARSATRRESTCVWSVRRIAANALRRLRWHARSSAPQSCYRHNGRLTIPKTIRLGASVPTGEEAPRG